MLHNWSVRMIPDVWYESGFVWYRLFTLLWYGSMYTKRLRSVWYDLDIFWVVRTNYLCPQKTIRAEAAEEIYTRQTIPARRG
jgi:hypothetical protein